MTSSATVLVPTHNHGRLLQYSVGSALGQSVDAIEVFIVGDGADDETRATAFELCDVDSRVRFFDNPKGPRHGEVYRHAALEEASGEIVCYLSDDDLWLPTHIEEMLKLLDDHDFAHALAVGIRTDGTLHTWIGSFESQVSWSRIVQNQNFIPLSCGAHRMDLYRELSAGWQTTPPGIPTDVYMWGRILQHPGCRAISGRRPTAIHFPSPWRREMSLDQRLAEVSAWSERLSDPSFEEELTSKAIGEITRVHADQGGALEASHEQRGALERARADDAELIRRLQTELDETRRKLRAKRDRLDSISQSKTWRARAAVLRAPGIGPLARWALGVRRRGKGIAR